MACWVTSIDCLKMGIYLDYKIIHAAVSTSIEKLEYLRITEFGSALLVASKAVVNK